MFVFLQLIYYCLSVLLFYMYSPLKVFKHEFNHTWKWVEQMTCDRASLLPRGLLALCLQTIPDDQ